MARTEAVQEGRRRRAAAAAMLSTEVHAALVAQALRILARNADRMHFSKGREEWDGLGARNGRIWRAISQFGIDDDVLAGLRERHGKLPPAVKNWRKARLARTTVSSPSARRTGRSLPLAALLRYAEAAPEADSGGATLGRDSESALAVSEKQRWRSCA